MGAKVAIIFILAATFATQASNFIAIKIFDINDPYISALKAAMYTVPLAIVATVCFNIYFGSGHTSMSYAALNAIAIGTAILIGSIVHLILNSHQLSLIELVGCALIVAGIAVIIFKKQLGGA